MNVLMRSYFLSETCLICVLGDDLSFRTNEKVLQLYRTLIHSERFKTEIQVLDLVPAYNALAIHFRPRGDHQQIQARITDYINQVDFTDDVWQQQNQTHTIEVVYDGCDLAESAKKVGLSKQAFIQKHSEPAYRIAMLGFKPNMPYLLGLDEQLAMPRLDSPRSQVSRGSVAIGGAQTSVFPVDMPSGWRIIGSTDFRDFEAFQPGDTVIFKPING